MPDSGTVMLEGITPTATLFLYVTQRFMATSFGKTGGGATF
jgi:hypothetical protein